MLKEAVKARRLRGRVRVSSSGCQDRCENGPNVMVFPDNCWYSHVREEDIETIIDDVVGSLERAGQLPHGYGHETGQA
jgi:(2Fe-2S) ferredoxin